MTKKPYKLALVIFRRDLRLHDNTAFIQASQQAEKILPCFIFDPRQIGSSNDYRSMNAVQFMFESLDDLATQLKKINGKLYFFSGIADSVVQKTIRSNKAIDAVFCNRDYTPFSTQRDTAIKKVCMQNSVTFHHIEHDTLLTEPEDITTGSGKPYKVFTPFFKNAFKKNIAQPQKILPISFYTQKIAHEFTKNYFTTFLKKKNNNILLHGGRTEGLKILKKIGQFDTYKKERDYPAVATTHLSAHLKFGTLSVREVYHTIEQKLGKKHLLIQQLFWRDFFTHVAFNAPRVFGEPFKEKYKKLSWSKSKKNFAAWCEGKTGFPLVDAGMRQLNATGFMHNRVRMIVGSFLTKDLHIDWRWGEKYFAQKLVDYDPSVNNGNWQWVASTGCDAQPYFRIFNPWLQQKKYDAHATYIKEWVPELKDIPAVKLHTLYKKSAPAIANYPSPIVDHAIESKKAKNAYKKAAQQ